MKWFPLILMLVALTLGELGVEDGYSSTDNFVVCRNAFCYNVGGPLAVPCSSSFTVFITSPVNGSSYYWSPPSTTINTTVTQIGGTACYYRIDGGSWNVMNCIDGVNRTYAMVTYPEGYPVTVWVNVSQGCGDVLNFTQVNVYGRPRYGGLANFFVKMLLWVVMPLMLLLAWWQRRKKRRF